MQINTTTMRFDELTPEEASALLLEVDLLRFNQIAYSDCTFLNAWCEALGYDESDRLLVATSSFPQQALRSIVEFYRS